MTAPCRLFLNRQVAVQPLFEGFNRPTWAVANTNVGRRERHRAFVILGEQALWRNSDVLGRPIFDPSIKRGARNRQAGAEHTFVNHALEAIERAGGDANKVEWNKVEGAAAQEAVGKHGQSPQSAARAICELSPHRANPASHPKVEAWAKERGPVWQKEYEAHRGQRRGLER